MENSVLTYIRKGHDTKNDIYIALNLTPVPRENYRIGIPKKSGRVKELFNSDDEKYGGTGMNTNISKLSAKEWHSHKKSVEMTIPPLSIVIFK